MAQIQEWMYYEVAWRMRAAGLRFPFSWWQQQRFRWWSDTFDAGLFPGGKEAAFAANALYRYWDMVGVKDQHQECLLGQAGEVEPVYDEYSVSFFLFEPAARRLHLPQFVDPNGGPDQLVQSRDPGCLPVLLTRWRPDLAATVEHKILATTIGQRQRGVGLSRMRADLVGANPLSVWLCLLISPNAISGFQRRDRTGQGIQDRRISFMQYLPSENRVQVNAIWGPVFDTAPTSWGVYGNPNGSLDPQSYVVDNAFHDLLTNGVLNGTISNTDSVAGMCHGVFAWPLQLSPANPSAALDIRLPLDTFTGAGDLQEIRGTTADALEASNQAFWTPRLNGTGLQPTLPPIVAHLVDLFKICRANLLMLSDGGEIHPGPTIYDSFWVRDSSVEGIACALVGEINLPWRQFGQHYPAVFNLGAGQVNPASPAQSHGFFGGAHERDDMEWDSNGQALWAFGRFDRIQGPAANFGASVYSPYVVEGARWLRDNRDQYGLLFSGWSAEHLGAKDHPHYWDDFWAIAGLYEAARLAERLGKSEAQELWNIYGNVRQATAASIGWLLDQQRQRGFWETFIPTGPADVGGLNSTMVGAVAYFHPCRLYMGNKLGDTVDWAARMTLETIWSHFVAGGFRHDSAWQAFGPYLTLQLAHAFLLIGYVARMDQLLGWTVSNAGYPRVSRDIPGLGMWNVALGCWNEQHNYPVASDFNWLPFDNWYMGDIPHGWAAAELLLLLRDVLFFEADEDGQRHVFIAPGVMPHWVTDGQTVSVRDAPTLFGRPFGYTLTHHAATQTVEIAIQQQLPQDVSFVYPCRFGNGVSAATADGRAVSISGRDVVLPPGTTSAVITYN